MANRHGGYRRPQNPAPASGPGKLSKRTDGGPGQKLMAPTGMDYGQHQALLAQERTAPMQQANPIPPAPVPSGPSGGAPASPAGAPPTPFGAPTARPGEPVTAGVDIGAGPGSEVLPAVMQPAFNAQGPMTQMLSNLGPLTGDMAALYQAASIRGA